MKELATKAETVIPRGATIDRYLVRGWIAQGAMGEVYAAYDPVLDRKLAIKLVRVERDVSAHSVDARTRFLRDPRRSPSCRTRTWSSFMTSEATRIACSSRWSSSKGGR